MNFSKALKATANIAYKDMTKEFCRVTGKNNNDVYIFRFICPETNRNIQVSFDLREKFAVFSAENVAILNDAERRWIENFYQHKTQKTPNKGFDFIDFYKAL